MSDEHNIVVGDLEIELISIQADINDDDDTPVRRYHNMSLNIVTRSVSLVGYCTQQNAGDRPMVQIGVRARLSKLKVLKWKSSFQIDIKSER